MKKKVEPTVCTCPYQKKQEYCHPDCLMLKSIKESGGKVEEVKEKGAANVE